MQWLNEPNELDFTDDTTGFPCAMRRNHGGAWCGYVGVPEGHRLFGKSYSNNVVLPGGFLDSPREMDSDFGVMELLIADPAKITPERCEIHLALAVRCHGSLTFSDAAWWEPENKNWWFGFDCSHSGDLSPKYPNHGGTYRDVEYVKAQCHRLAIELDIVAQLL